jgi:nucleotide-binding universal stress UspA family protein
MTIQRILCPTDFSVHSAAALQYAVSLARDSRATIILLHVAEPIPVHREVPYATIYEPDINGLRGQLDAVAIDPAVKVIRRVVLGSPLEAVLEVAEEEHADLIVMGTHGRTGIAHMLIGSVAEQMMRAAPCPVLTLKAPSPVAATAGS